MAPKTRYFLIASALVVVVGLCTGLVAYYSASLPSSSADRAELAYLPADAAAIGYADVAAILNSSFSQRLRQLLPTGDDRAQFEAETGINLERDVESVVIAVTGAAAGRPGGVVIVRGRFDPSKVEAAASSHGARVDSYRNVRLLIAPAGESDTAGVAFLADGLVAIGTRPSLEAAIDAATLGQGADHDADLMRTVAGIDAGGQAWLVGRTARMAEGPGLPDVVRQHLGGVEWIALGASIDTGIRARVRAEARDEQAAQDLIGTVNGLISAARLMSNRDARLESALSSIQTTGSGATVEVEFTLPADLIDVARNMVPSDRSSR